MLKLILNNDYINVSGDYTKQDINIINDECSYSPPQAEYSPKFQEGIWDGRISLFSKRTLSFPSGLLTSVSQKLDEYEIEYQVVDNRAKPIVSKRCAFDIGEHSLRDYQSKAIEIFKQKTRGIWAMATGAGKTKTAGGLIAELSVFPVIFVVPSVSLLKQTAREFNESLKPLDDLFLIGVIGGGECHIAEHGVNVATYHTLLTAFNKKYDEKKKKVVDVVKDGDSIEGLQRQLKYLNIDLANVPKTKIAKVKRDIKKIETRIKEKEKLYENKIRIRELVESCQLLIIDETHIAAETVEMISLKAKKAYYKLGLSGTPQRQDNQDIRMFGSTGSIIHRVTSSDLIRKGFLVRPYINVIDLDFMDRSANSYPETYKNAIVTNDNRNELIKLLAEEMHGQGRPTLVLVERLNHGETLQGMIENSLFVPGTDGSNDEPIPDEELDYRKYQLDRLEKGEIIMIATSWAFTGIDAPKIGCLILGCSIGSPNTVIQQLGRGIRKAHGKENCVVFDFKHKEKSLRNHFNSRNAAYKTEEEFVVRIFKYNKSKGSYV